MTQPISMDEKEWNYEEEIPIERVYSFDEYMEVSSASDHSVISIIPGEMDVKTFQVLLE